MNPGALVVNCARGGLVDEAAAKKLIDTGHLAGIALDVFEVEPPPADFALLGVKNAFSPRTSVRPPPRPRKTSALKWRIR